MFKNDPREITAKFDCVCAETKRKIKKGEACIYYPLHKQVFAIESKEALSFYQWKADIQMGYNY